MTIKKMYIKKIKNLFKVYLVLVISMMNFMRINCKDLHLYNTFVHIIFLGLDICLRCFIAFVFILFGGFAYLRNIVLK
jgi:hypothetical protein